MEIFISITSALFFLSELILLILKRSKSNEVKIKKDKSSLIALWTTISISLFLGIYFSLFQQGNVRFILLPWMGIFIFFLGAIIRWTAILQLRKEFTVDVAISQNHKMKEDGLYKKIRHPSYLGLLLEFLGFSLFYSNWITILIINVPIFLALVYRMKIEEELLTDAFGIEYENYKKRTNKIFPGIF